jgi:pimeloyl-ACP methyl ester carboxylesterase
MMKQPTGCIVGDNKTVMPSAAGMYFAMNDGGQKEQPPVILLHGAGSNHKIWPAAIRRLPGQRVFAVDLPGHGHSPGFGLQSIDAYADQMVELLAALGLYQAIFVGHAMGGAVAINLAVRHSAHVAGLGLVSSGAYLGVPQDLLDAFSNPLTLQHAFHLFQQRAFNAAVAGSVGGAQASIVERCLSTLKECRPSVLASDWQASAAFDLRSEINQVNVPGWVIVGTEDHLTPVAYSHFLAGHLPAGHLQIVPGAGHMVILEQPDQVAHSLQHFVTALTSARMAGTRITPVSSTVSVSQHSHKK